MARTLGIDPVTINWIMLPSLLLSIPAYIICGWLTDKLGRKPVFLAGTLLAALSLQPAFRLMAHVGNPALESAQRAAPVVVVADPATCSLQFNPVSVTTLTSSCDIAKGYLAGRMVSYENQPAPAGEVASVRIGNTLLPAFDGARLPKGELAARQKQFQADVQAALTANGYPHSADPATVQRGVLICLMTYLLSLLALIYTPAGAWMTELFPTRIRYTAISLPYNIGAGWVGGFMPSVAFAMVAANGGVYFGLWYPVATLAAAVVIAGLGLPDTRHRRPDASVGEVDPFHEGIHCHAENGDVGRAIDLETAQDPL